MNQTTMLAIERLHPFRDHPYYVRNDAEMDALAESIREHGILSPLIVRPLENAPGEYEVVSGHRRLFAAKVAGLREVPAMIRTLDRDAAAIALVDSNLHREHILPSEKAFAYKMKLEAIKHQGRTSGQVGPKLSTEEISDSDSARQVKRYIRLTHLSRSLLNLVDEGQIALTPAVELSFLTESEQADLTEAIAYAGATPSLSQAQQMKRLSQEGQLTAREMERILSEPKPNQREQLRLRRDELKRFFPANCSGEQMKRDILRGLELLHRQRSRGQER